MNCHRPLPGSHVVFCRTVGDRILIVRVLRKRMDANRQFQD